MAYNQRQNYWQPQNYAPATPPPQVRPVSSFEEVRAIPIDFDGSIFYFSDMANKRIYTKQIGPDGAPLIYMYEQKEIQPISFSDSSNYVTKDELDSKLKSLYETLKRSEQTPAAKPTFDF